ncbi:hypothetical protein K1719_019431 [Acacia pycnantha]|nr:hypothetical protein K1719_019431 [Acacia pycnantha]
MVCREYTTRAGKVMDMLGPSLWDVWNNNSHTYHHNVSDSRLSQHMEKENEDGLYINSVASCSNLRAIIMDAGTGFSDQFYELSPYFLHNACNLVCGLPMTAVNQA